MKCTRIPAPSLFAQSRSAAAALLLVVALVAVGCSGHDDGDAAGQGENVFLSARVLNIAHRGGNRVAPEHTFPAFESALAIGADVLEMDFRVTADGVLNVAHRVVQRCSAASVPRRRARRADQLCARRGGAVLRPHARPGGELPAARAVPAGAPDVLRHSRSQRSLRRQGASPRSLRGWDVDNVMSETIALGADGLIVDDPAALEALLVE